MTAKRRSPIAALTLALGATLGALPAAEARDFKNDGVASANPRYDSVMQPNLIAAGFSLRVIARGTAVLENPSGVITHFGVLSDFPPQTVEATKTEPDENTYVVFDHNPGGPTAGFDYGRHFLVQGHENGNNLAYVTRINLDVADPRHRITLLTPAGADGKTHLNRIDGSTWNPHTRSFLFAQENGVAGGVFAIGGDWGSAPRTFYGSIGHGSYEGIHPDDRGNLLIVEDAAGPQVNVVPADPNSPRAARLPNSFVYRFVPSDPSDLTRGKLQALQVTIGGQPLVYVPIDATHPFGDVFSDAQLKLHSPGSSWPVRWVTLHDTAVDGSAEFDANAAAKKAGATPFKRPENAQFLPGSGFRTFFFAPTGDTDVNAGNQQALAVRGAWGSIFRVDLDASRDSGTISLFALGDSDHCAFDNLAFASARMLFVAEDRGGSLHKQLNRLDSIWAYDVTDPHASPVRLLALGRDNLATIDAHLLDAGTAGYQNDGDNEPTGVHVSNGDATLDGLLGTAEPTGAWRWFFTQQHGRNQIFEIAGDRDLQ